MDANPKKLSYIREATRPLRNYCAKLAEALLFNRVAIPAGWLNAQQKAFVDLDEEATLTGEVLAVAERLVPLVIGLCSVLIPRLINDYVRRRGLLDRQERESLRRSRGPAAVRTAIFRVSPTWPPIDPRRLSRPVRLAVDDALAVALAQFRDSRSGVHPAIGDDTWRAVAAVVRQYARKKHLADADAAWLLSEVSAQLISSNDQGRAPRDLNRWALATAKYKQSHRAQIDVKLHPAQPPVLGRPDDGFARTDLAFALKATGTMLAELAARLETVAEPENAAIYKIAAAVLQEAQPVENVVAFLENEEWAHDAMAAELRTLGLDPHPARVTAAAEIIKATLRDALRDCPPQSAQDASA